MPLATLTLVPFQMCIDIQPTNVIHSLSTQTQTHNPHTQQ